MLYAVMRMVKFGSSNGKIRAIRRSESAAWVRATELATAAVNKSLDPETSICDRSISGKRILEISDDDGFVMSFSVVPVEDHD